MSQNSATTKKIEILKNSEFFKDQVIKEEKKAFNQKEYNQQYYLDNKHIKTKCELCGGKTSPFNKFQHEKTKKHQQKINEKKTPTFDDLSKLLLSKASELGMTIKIDNDSFTIQK
jgi:hypothetical protein